MVPVVNHVPRFSYDGMGNVKVDNLLNNYTYDAEGRPITAAGVQTTFDAFGRALELNHSGTYTQMVYSPSGWRHAVMNGQSLVKWLDPMVAGMAAIHNGDGTGYFQHADWLGSSRLAVTGGGTVQYDRAYAPFGEPYAETATTNRDFTGQTEDTTPGLYDFLFRQQSQSQGRWLVPDPAGLAAVDITNPQTWNRYAYVGNNPLSAVDPLGLDMCDNWWGCLFDEGGGGYTDTGYCPPSEESCGDDGGGGIGIGIGGGGGGGGGTTPPGNPPSQPIHFPDETNGIPNGLNLNWGGVWGAIIPTATCGDMGPCNPIGNGAFGEEAAAG
jgi:RHS repeat-associated protein